jgi:hypothetical protein
MPSIRMKRGEPVSRRICLFALETKQQMERAPTWSLLTLRTHIDKLKLTGEPADAERVRAEL